MAVLRRLSVLFYTTAREKRDRYDRLVNRMEQQETKLSILFHHASSILWLEMTGATASRVCALPKQLDFLLSEDIWQEAPSRPLQAESIQSKGIRNIQGRDFRQGQLHKPKSRYWQADCENRCPNYRA